MSSNVVIIGAGVVGLSTAYYAAGKGHRVTILEKRPAGHAGCSWGNAGMIVPSHVIPLAEPGVMRMAARWMFDSESPFWVKPRIDRGLMGWGLKFYRASTRERVERAAPLLRDLNFASLACFERFAEESSNSFGLNRSGILMLCNTAHGLADEMRAASFASSIGVPAEVLDSAGVAALEPGLRLTVAGGVFYPRDATLSPDAFMKLLLRLVAERGVEIRYETEVTGWRNSRNAIGAVQTTEGDLRADHYVVCGGSWSPSVVRQLGVRIPIEAGKGYSLTLPSPRKKPGRGLILSEARIAVTPMGDSLRIGGTMEIAGMDEAVRASRIRGLTKSVPRYMSEFGAADFDGVEPWCGLRPCSPDGLPYVGPVTPYENLWTATGHAMMGLSLGPITGKLMSELLSGEAPSIDIAQLSPDRYSRRVREM